MLSRWHANLTRQIKEDIGLNTRTKRLRYFACGLFVFIAVGCGTTAIMQTHPLLADPLNVKAAKVYFIRSDSGFDGVRGNAYTISLDGQDLLTISKGEYTLVYLMEYSGDMTVVSSDVVNRGGLNTWIKVKGSRRFLFEGSKTYYITFERSLHDPFQGTAYIPTGITETVAKRMAGTLKPIGEAVAHPL